MSQQYFIKLSNGCTYPYQIMPSLRAKRLTIRFSVANELMLVLPRGMQVSLAHDFLQKKRAWVEKQIKKSATKAVINSKPSSLHLKMLHEQWSVSYVTEKQDSVEYCEHANNRLLISGNIHSDLLIEKVIGLFLKNKATLFFTQMLCDIAVQQGFEYSGLTVRGQKTRWGSCSNRKKINLNYKLLFMPEEVARYVFIHELCHTIEMNHSAQFWALVKKYDPNYQQHQHYLKQHGDIIRYF
jgi:predicted metal-dependent hydrolase